MKFVKKFIISLITICTTLSCSYIFNQKQFDIWAYQNGTDTFSIADNNGNVEFVKYNADVHLQQDEDGVVTTNGKVYADSTDVDVAILPTGTIYYTEYDGTAKGRTGYTNGSSANFAAFIGYVDPSDRTITSTTTVTNIIRVKQAGVFMDINTSTYNNVTLVNHTSINSSELDYYDSAYSESLSTWYFYHNYSYTNKNLKRQHNDNELGLTPDYLAKNKTTHYYSFDGNYFYTSFDSMIQDYRKGAYVHTNAVNSTNPYYSYYQYLSVRAPTTYTADKLDYYYSTVLNKTTNSKMYACGSKFIAAAKQYGVNALIMYADAALESGWGTSDYAMGTNNNGLNPYLCTNNLFGIKVYDSSPSSADSYSTIEEGLKAFAYTYISSKYLNVFGSLYRGPHEGNKQSGINVKYASDPYKGEQVASIATIIDRKLGGNDIGKYKIAVSETNDVYYYQNSDFTGQLYISGPKDNTNDCTRNTPVTIISTVTGGYKVFSDATLKTDRSGVSVTSEYTIPDDMSSFNNYCYVKADNLATCSHSTTTTVTINTATCTATGLQQTRCSNCGYIVSTSTIPVDSSNHNYASSVTGATCTSQGYTTHTCTRCGTSYTDSYTSALGHSYTTITSAKITRNKVTRCTRCGATSTGSRVTSKTIYKGKTYNEGVKGTWKSSNKKIATVTSTGKITAKKAGTCTITAKVNGTTYKCKITVKNKTLTVSKSSVTLKKGKSTTVTAKATPSATVKWSSSNKKVATVSNGRITAKKKGSCTISVKANGITKKIKVKVK